MRPRIGHWGSEMEPAKADTTFEFVEVQEEAKSPQKTCGTRQKISPSI